MNKDKLSFKYYLPVLLNCIFPILLFSLMFVFKSEIGYLNNFKYYQPYSLKLNLIASIIIFKIVILSILFCYFIVEIFIYQKFLINVLNKISIYLVSFYLLLQILFVSLAFNTYVTYNENDHYLIFTNLNYLGLLFSAIYEILLIIFYFLFVHPIKKEIEEITNEYIGYKKVNNNTNDISNFDKFKQIKQDYIDNKISKEEYEIKLKEILDEELKDDIK